MGMRGNRDMQEMTSACVQQRRLVAPRLLLARADEVIE
jgi:hypothetical protein